MRKDFKQDCLYLVEYMDPRGMEEYLYKLSGTREVYYMGDLFIGKLSLKDAVDRADGDVCIIYCGNGIAYYQGEEDMAAPPRYLRITSKDAGPISSTALWNRICVNASPHFSTASFFSSRNSR